MSSSVLCVAVLAATLALARGLDNGFRLPVLGFNSWNSAAAKVNETFMREMADAFVNLGLVNSGYTYVDVDDAWCSSRDANGTLVADPVTFPSGMKSLADYIHAKGLKFGIYSSNSPLTCNQRPGSFGHEFQDAATFAEWGVDLLKYDNCGDQDTIGPPERGYSVMRDALNASGRPIYFSACEWAVDFPSTWMAPVANSWRTTYDIQNYWECVVPHLDWQDVFAPFFGPGAVGDLDILEVGNGVLTDAESVAHFSLWAALRSPLLIGCALTSPTCVASLWIMNNTEVIALNQDPLVQPVRRVWSGAGDKGVPYGKSGICGTEELPQNTIIAPCDSADPLQSWTFLPNGTLLMNATGECLQLDSGQGGCCSQGWTVWTNNVASALCNDPASCCGSRQQLWTYDATLRTLVSNVSGQCVTVHAGGMHNVGASPCTTALQGLQTWDWVPATGQFISSASPPGRTGPSCLARTANVGGGASEVWAGPLANGDVAVILFNRNNPGPANISATWPMLGLAPGTQMRARDLWAHADLPGTFDSSVSGVAEVHGVVVLRLSAVAA